MEVGDDMEQIGNISVLFIAGFGPIVREATASRKLYDQVLGRSVAAFASSTVLFW
jgi:hypothetical protein